MRYYKWNKRTFFKNVLAGLMFFIMFYGLWYLTDLALLNGCI